MKHCIPFVLACLLVQVPAFAQDETPDPPKPSAPDDAPKPKDDTPVAKPVAKPDAKPAPKNDIINLKTGEVLQGQIIQLDGGKLKIKSLQMGEQVIPWDKVASVKTAKPHTFVLKDGTEVKGVVLSSNGEFKLQQTDGTERTFLRGDLTTINPSPDKVELDYWTLSLTLGATATYGNTRTRTFGALLGLVREDDNTRASLQASTIYGFASGEETAKAHRLDGQFDYKVTDRFYVTPIVGHAFYDKFQNIKLRYRVGSGVGYFLLKDPKTITWNVEAGLAYGVTELRRAPLGTHKQYDTSARAATKLHWIVSSWLTADAFYETYIGLKKINNTVHRATFNLGFKIYKGVALNIAGIYDRVESPQRGTDGKIPKKDDFKLIIGLGLTL